MSCGEKHFSDMIYAYELGLLPEENRREFEIHLMECDSCFENLNKFKQEAYLLKNDPDVQESVKQFLEKNDTEVKKSSARITHVGPKNLWRTLIPIAAAAAVFLILILKDWQIEIGPSKEAIAAENRIAIMYFENLSDPTDSLRMGEIAANLLMTDLAESEYLNIVSSQRLYDLLKLIDQEGIKSISKETASQIAVEAKADWILMGNILQTQPNIIITTQLIDVATGDIFASQQITGNPDEEIFSVIDRLTIKTKENLSLPSDALFEPDPHVADYTTSSPIAYRHYLKGIENVNKIYISEAIINFEAAIKHDSKFAMAYYYLAKLKDHELLCKALDYSDRAGTIDRLYIKILEASYGKNIRKQRELLNELISQYPEEKEGYFQLAVLEYGQGNYEVSILLLNDAIKIDPKMKMAYNQLAYTYNQVGDFEKALLAIDNYIELAPDEANPLDTKAEIYALNGMLDYAVESYRKALTIKPDFYASLKSLSLMYMFKGQYYQADSCLDILVEVEQMRFEALRLRAQIPLFQGKFSEALKILDDAISSSEKEYAGYHFQKSRIYLELKNWTRALDEIEEAIEIYEDIKPADKATYRYFRIQILAQIGDLIEAKEKAEELKTYVEETDNSHYACWYAVGTIDMAEGNFDKACISFERSRDYNNEFFVGYMLARAYYLDERYNEAIAEFKKVQEKYNAQRSYFSVFSVKFHYYLGLAYEKNGQYDLAIKQYETFLNIWKNADEGLESVKEAKERLAELKKNSKLQS